MLFFIFIVSSIDFNCFCFILNFKFYHQMRHRFFDTIFESGRQLNASLNSFELAKTPLKRIRPGQWVSSKAHFVAIVVCVSHQS